MCGIFGWISFKRPLSERQVNLARAATALLAHRGPDNQGEWLTPHVYLGHRRLSIIDLSPAANQPFTNERDDLRLCYNGEVYNYVELREELTRGGRRFRTDSDTEVVLAALDEWGPSALRRFDGMFAAGMHDSRGDSHLIFRDALGQKPLYYYAYDDGLVYASELRALLALECFSWKIDRPALARFLSDSYYVLEDTPIVGIKKLLPGCYLKVACGQVQLERYWESRPGDDLLDIGLEETLNQFERLFRDSCRIAMRSDVPYGVFLSGGIDSSLVLAHCKAINAHVRSFTVGMSERDYDESDKAAAVNRCLGITDFHRFVLDQDKVTEAVETFFQTSDEPHGDPGFVNASFLARSCRPYLTVGLAGDGGDELFAGYAPFVGLWAVPFLRPLPDPVIAAMRRAAELLPADDRYLSLRFRVSAYLQGFPATDAARFPRWLGTLGHEELAQLLRMDRSKRRSAEDVDMRETLYGFSERLLAPLPQVSLQQKLAYFYQKTFLPEFVCMHTDRAAMQSSLEVRSPFLSVPLIEFANRLPDNLKLRGGALKWLLKRVGERAGLPPEIIAQRKQGFTFPISRWLKTSLRPNVDALVDDRQWTEDLIDPPTVRALYEQHLSGQRNNYRILFNLAAWRRWRYKYSGCSVA
jgi:asparagine synthase (glutamine-hydrolysing)